MAYWNIWPTSGNVEKSPGMNHSVALSCSGQVCNLIMQGLLALFLDDIGLKYKQ